MIRKLAALAAAVFLTFAPLAAFADADESAAAVGVDPTTVGLQPLHGAIPAATPFPGESRLKKREDGTYGAIPTVHGATKTFSIVEREAPWTLMPGLTVMAKTYNGVVPGPTISVNQGDHVVIHYHNAIAVADTIHLHGIHGEPQDMDGVGGISQPMVQPGGDFTYAFTARQSGTFIYHTHDQESMLNSGLYGAITVIPSHPLPNERTTRDDVEMLSSWMIQSNAENHFTINGKEYPATAPIEVKKDEHVRIRWINMSGENFHTMHTHGHDMTIIARDAQPLTYKDVEDTINIGPGQRVDVVLTANAQPGTWLVHCHVADHIEDANGMPAGLVTTIHYAGTPYKATAMADAMMSMPMPSAPGGSPPGKMSFGKTIVLGAIAGLTIFFGLPIARFKRLSPAVIGALNALAIGILVYLIIEIAGNASIPLEQALTAWNRGRTGHSGLTPALPIATIVAYVAGLFVGLVGLGAVASRMAKAGANAKIADRPLVLAGMIAIGIGAHNFAEGLAIGASAASGATAIAFGLILGFGLHNATEGFGIAAPIAGRGTPATWGQIALAGIVAGGPTFLGTVIGYKLSSPTLSAFFLTTAVGALVFVVGELWSVLKRSGITVTAMAMLGSGFLVAFATEIYVGLNGG
jgi:ZIP family zinc transporter